MGEMDASGKGHSPGTADIAGLGYGGGMCQRSVWHFYLMKSLCTDKVGYNVTNYGRI